MTTKHLPNAHSLARQRQAMVTHQLASRDIVDPAVLAAMGRIPREQFIPDALWECAYDDAPLPIGHQQTISQPYIVALSSQLVRPRQSDRGLDIGTGSGYQAAVLAELIEHVDSVELVEPLAEQAAERLRRLGYHSVSVHLGDGYQGWPEHAPYDVIIVAAAAPEIPRPLIDQLAIGGRLVIPVQRSHAQQQLLLIEKEPDGSLSTTEVAPVSFVPLVSPPPESG
jgi:protein-L-isoaspartate(D-aspartate) O-methyltransferase